MFSSGKAPENTGRGRRTRSGPRSLDNAGNGGSNARKRHRFLPGYYPQLAANSHAGSFPQPGLHPGPYSQPGPHSFDYGPSVERTMSLEPLSSFAMHPTQSIGHKSLTTVVISHAAPVEAHGMSSIFEGEDEWGTNWKKCLKEYFEAKGRPWMDYATPDKRGENMGAGSEDASEEEVIERSAVVYDEYDEDQWPRSRYMPKE